MFFKEFRHFFLVLIFCQANKS